MIDHDHNKRSEIHSVSRPIKSKIEASNLNTHNSSNNSHGAQLLRATIDDIPKLQKYFDSLLAPSLHTRLFATTKAVPEIILQLIQDSRNAEYSEYAGVYIAVNENEPNTVIGEAMLAACQIDTAGHRSAEIALSTSDKWRRTGLGNLLFDRLLAEAISANFNHLFADAFHTNYAFISLAKKKGFSLGKNPDDWSLVRLSRTLETESLAV